MLPSSNSNSYQIEQITYKSLERLLNIFFGDNPSNLASNYPNSFTIVFDDGTKWVLFSSPFVSSRMTTNQQVASALKRTDHRIGHVYWIIPDGLFELTRSTYNNPGNQYAVGSIDRIVSQKEIYHLVEDKLTKHLKKGDPKDIQGRYFEKRVAALLSDPANVERYTNRNPEIEGLHYHIFEEIVNCFGLDKNTTKTIDATSDSEIIGKLPPRNTSSKKKNNPRNPKTDVIVYVELTDGTKKTYTVSCKRSSKPQVSVHQYPADTYADVLDQDNKRLRELLNTFQKKGTLKDFSATDKIALENELKPHVRRLCNWALGGYGDMVYSILQYANFLVTLKNKDGSVRAHSLGDYREKIICYKRGKKGKKGVFGTPFSWTFASKRRGKNIQLKCKLL